MSAHLDTPQVLHLYVTPNSKSALRSKAPRMGTAKRSCFTRMSLGERRLGANFPLLQALPVKCDLSIPSLSIVFDTCEYDPPVYRVPKTRSTWAIDKEALTIGSSTSCVYFLFDMGLDYDTLTSMSSWYSMVRLRGLEPPRLSAYGPKPYVVANYTTGAGMEPTPGIEPETSNLPSSCSTY